MKLSLSDVKNITKREILAYTLILICYRNQKHCDSTLLEIYTVSSFAKVDTKRLSNKDMSKQRLYLIICITLLSSNNTSKT